MRYGIIFMYNIDLFSDKQRSFLHSQLQLVRFMIKQLLNTEHKLEIEETRNGNSICWLELL